MSDERQYARLLKALLKQQAGISLITHHSSLITNGRLLMLDYIFNGLVAAGLLVYLLYALLKPERF